MNLISSAVIRAEGGLLPCEGPRQMLQGRGGYRHAARTNSFRGAVPLMKQGNLLILVSCVQVIKSPRPPLRRKETGLRHHPEDQIGITGREQRLEWGLNFLFPHSSAGKAS